MNHIPKLTRSQKARLRTAFLKAAVLIIIDREEYACCAIEDACYGPTALSVLAENYFAALFKPHDARRTGPWWSHRLDYDSIEARAFALLLAAETLN